MLGFELDEPLVFVLTTLATWRVSALIAYESGPFLIFERLRRLIVWARMARLVSCFHCLSLWIAAVMALVVYPLQAELVLAWLALAGSVSIIERWLGGVGSEEASEDGL